MTEYKPLTKQFLFYVDDENDLVMYVRAEDEYQASMEWEGVYLVDVRSAVMLAYMEICRLSNDSAKYALIRAFPVFFEEERQS